MKTETEESDVFGFLDEIQAQPDALGTDENRQLLNNLFVLMRTGFMHHLDNDALLRPINMMLKSVEDIMEHTGNKIRIRLVDGNFFIDGRLLQLDFSTFQNSRYLARIFQFLGINELDIGTGLDDPSLRCFLKAFLKVVRDGEGSILDHDLKPISVGKRPESSFEKLARKEDPRDYVMMVYASGLLMLRRFVNDIRKSRKPQYAKVKRLCLQLVDFEPRHYNLLLALIHLEGYKGNLFCRMLNTAVLAISFGRRVGLNRRQLLELGMAAFYHDLGWALLGTLGDEDKLEDVALSMKGIKQTRNSSADLSDLRTRVARSLVRIGGFNELIISRLIVAFECQIPDSKGAENLYSSEIGSSFMTDVVRMSSAYDEATTADGADGHALSPDEAMRQILDDSGKTYDDFLAKLFVNCMGAYPVGSMVELDTGELGIVVNLPTDPIHYNRPQVKVVTGRDGDILNAGKVVDLSKKLRSGQFQRSVERCLIGRDYGLDITQFFYGCQSDGLLAEL